MLTHDYAKATLELIHDGKSVEDVLAGLRATTKRRGHSAILSAILREVLRGIEKALSDSVAEVRVAREKDSATLSNHIRDILATMGDTTTTKTVVDEQLIGGVVVKHRDKVVDASYKTQLLTVYRALTK